MDENGGTYPSWLLLIVGTVVTLLVCGCHTIQLQSNNMFHDVLAHISAYAPKTICLKRILSAA